MFLLSTQPGADRRKLGQHLSSLSQAFTLWLHYLVWKWFSKADSSIIKCKYKRPYKSHIKNLYPICIYSPPDFWLPAIQSKHPKMHFYSSKCNFTFQNDFKSKILEHCLKKKHDRWRWRSRWNKRKIFNVEKRDVGAFVERGVSWVKGLYKGSFDQWLLLPNTPKYILLSLH